MFKINVEKLQSEIGKMVSAAKRSRLSNSHIFVKSSESKGTVTFSFVGELLSVERVVETEVTEDFSFATSVLEFQLKVSSLPAEIELTFTKREQGHMYIKWGRNSGIVLLTVEKEEQPIKRPEGTSAISMSKGDWHYIARNFAPFTALPTSAAAQSVPTAAGVHFSKSRKGVQVQATNSHRAIKSVLEMDWFDEDLSIPSDVFYSVAELIPSSEIITVTLDDTKTKLIIEGENVLAVARILDGKFVDTDAMFCDATAPILWRADRMALLETTRRVKKLGSVNKLGSENPILYVFKKDTRHFAVLKGVLTEQIGAVVETDDETGFVVNANNLEAALTVLRSDEVILAFLGKSKPITLFSGDIPEDSEGKVIKIDPMKVMIGQMKI